MDKRKIIAIIVVVGVLWGMGLLLRIDPGNREHLLAWAQSAARETPLKVFINGKESAIKPKSEKGEHLFPLNLPFREGTTQWHVEFTWDKEKNVLKVDTRYIHPKPMGKLREEWHICSLCNGMGKCQHCYPAGSGKVYGEGSDPCTWCNGTGKCWYCGGAGGWK